VKQAQADLSASAQKIGQALYAQQAADADGSGGAGGSASAGDGQTAGSSADDDIVDAEVIDEDQV
ncbi:MAG: hypothetical protein LBD70_05250, partial [Bifidobacteriaceae bacterium]|nr:hypothetical protein [Bifidobacteriaceae bacterium]